MSTVQNKIDGEIERGRQNIAAERRAFDREREGSENIDSDLKASKAESARLQNQLESVRRDSALKAETIAALRDSLREFNDLARIVGEVDGEIRDLRDRAAAFLPNE